MDPRSRARRVGTAAILCALTLRLFDAGVPGKIAEFLAQTNVTAFLTYLETGRNVRFSPSLQAFSPKFVESPPPLRPESPEPVPPTLPHFSAEDLPRLYYGCRVSPDVPALLEQPLSWDLTGKEPTVLILSTHTTESYTPQGEPYVESSRWRTLDEGYNMLSLGQLVGALLAEAGIPVLQDRTVHDYPSYNGSYVHARKSVREYLKEYPSIRMVLDLHRDAAGDGTGQLRTLASLEGQDSAQLMLVVGTNHDGYEENLSLALKLHAQLERQAPGLTRPLQLRAQRFNQDLSPGALLIEVGAAGNSHREARLAAEELARAIIALAGGTGTPEP